MSKGLYTSLDTLREALPSLAVEADTSFGLTVLARPLDAESLSVVLDATRFVDEVVVLYLPKNLSEKDIHQLKNIGISAIFHPVSKIKTPVRVVEDTHKIDVTLLLQTVLTVLPVSVFISPSEIALCKCFKALLDTFNDLFTVQAQPVAEASLTVHQRALRALKKNIFEAVSSGEDIRAILHEKMAAEYVSIAFYNPETLEEISKNTFPQLCIVTAKKDGETLREAFLFKRKKGAFWKKT